LVSPSNGATPDVNAAFLLEDYKLKVGWLANHYDRILRRSQLFLTLETAGAGTVIISSRGTLSPAAKYVAALELLISLVWLAIGRSDRRILTLSHRQLREDATRLGMLTGIPGLRAVGAVAECDARESFSLKWILEQPKLNDPPLSPSVIPALLVPTWLGVFVFLLVST